MDNKEIKKRIKKRFPLIEWFVYKDRGFYKDATMIRYHCGTEAFNQEVRKAIIEEFEVTQDAYHDELFTGKRGLKILLFWNKWPRCQTIRRKAIGWHAEKVRDDMNYMHVKLECGHLHHDFYIHLLGIPFEKPLPQKRLNCRQCVNEQLIRDEQERQLALEFLSVPIGEQQ